MAITSRQTGLLITEDWTKLYQTFRNADFQSYDYETLRKSMIDYLRIYYPEDFNDFIESSEFVAMIDMLSFLGQSIAFRGDLNSRENFIDTAERRDSILKLARLISYNPKRNTPASGFLKFDSVSTTETIYDSSGLNLSGLVINWDDAGNDDWLEQFTVILNAALKDAQVIGRPSNTQKINGIRNDEYQVNLTSNAAAITPYDVGVEGSSTRFEIVSATSENKETIYEVAPQPDQAFNFLYKSDGLGNASENTGFFLYFRQGEMQATDFTFTESVPNRVFPISIDNINNTDVWLYELDAEGAIDTEWTVVPTVTNTNVVYNRTTEKNIYQISTRADDQIDLVFGDGAFGDVPRGDFRAYYRTSNGLEFKVTPDEMQDIVISMDYSSRSGRKETINIRASLQYTVANTASRESLDEIKQKAPQQYYTQDRMITAEDYNILPFTLFNNVVKAKTVTRTSSGVSRYLDVIDATGKYSSTNIFAADGLLFKDTFERSFSFEYATRNDIYKTILNDVRTIAGTEATRQFFYDEYANPGIVDSFWNFSTEIANGSTGYFINSQSVIIQVGETVDSTNRYIEQGAIIKFSPGAGNCFDSRNNIKAGAPAVQADKFFIYAAVSNLLADGTNVGQGNLANGSGPITLSENVPQGAQASEVFTVLSTEFSQSLIDGIADLVETFEDFGVRYDQDTSEWVLISPQDLSLADFSLIKSGDTTSEQLDSSWIIRFETVDQTYTVYNRGLDYVFGSVEETAFYYDDATKVFDQKTGLTIDDQINVLKINSNPDDATPLGLDYQWYITDNIIEVDGYANTARIKVTFPDSDHDGIPDNPELFELIVNPGINPDTKHVYFKADVGYNNFVVLTPVNSTLIETAYLTLVDIENNKETYSDEQLFYIANLDTFYQLDVTDSVYTVSEADGYSSKVGRDNIAFQYRHNSPNYRRIDPAPNNIIDMFFLTKQYAADYVAWIRDTSNTLTEPVAPTGNDLQLEFGGLEAYKSVSDTIIYNPATYKTLFGAKATEELRATFKVVKNESSVVSDNEIKSAVITTISEYFDTDNWDFGEPFYFSELSAYIHSQLAPDIASIIIVPQSKTDVYGSLQQINAEYNEILISAATVDDVQVISAITLAQLTTV